MSNNPAEHSITYIGGSDDERAQVMRIFTTFWTANNTLDIEMLRPYWGDVVFFNSNGAVYHGAEEWMQVWRYYGARFTTTVPAELSAVTVEISGDLAVICDEGVLRGWQAVDVDEASAGIAPPQRVRTTVVLRRSDDAWQIVHAHFSPRGTGPRPAFPDEAASA